MSVHSNILDGPSSQTGNSLSQNPTRQSNVRQQDIGKFVRHKDKFAISNTALEERMNALDAIFSKALIELSQIEKDMQWQSATLPDLKGLNRRIGAVKVQIAQDEELYGKDGIYTYVGVVIEDVSLAAIMLRVAKLGMTSLLLNDRANTLFAVSESKVYRSELEKYFVHSASLFTPREDRQYEFTIVDLYITEYLKLIDPELICPFDKGEELTACFLEKLKKTVAPVKKTKLEQVKLQAIKTLLLQMLKICDADLKKSLIPSSRVPLVEAVIDHCERDIKRKRGQLAIEVDPALQSGGWSGVPLVPKADTAALIEFIQEPPLAEYVFKDHVTGLGPWQTTKYTWGYYNEHFTLGYVLETSVGQPLGGLLVRLKKEIVDAVAGTAINVKHLQSCIVTLEERFDQQFTAICAKEDNPLMPSLQKYAYGLAWGFDYARSLLQMAERTQGKDALEILKAATSIGEYYRDAPTFESLDAVINLFDPAERMQKIVLEKFSQNAEQMAKDEDPFYALLYKIAEYTNEVHANKDVQALKLSSHERGVPSEVLRLVSREPGNPLPVHVLTYLAKKMMVQSFLPSSDHDMELELVLHVLITHFEQEYLVSLDAYEYLRPIFGKYMPAINKNALARTILDEAAVIAKLVFVSQQKDWDTLSYVAAWQKLFEFERKHCGPDQLVDVRIDGLCSFLRYNLDEATRINEYDPVEPEVRQSDLEVWKTDKAAEFLNQLEGKPGLFNSIVQRIVGACLFAERNEELLAQAKLSTLLQTEAYEDLIDGLSSQVKLLLAENAMKKCMNAQVFTKWEKRFFLEKTASTFFESAYSGIDSTIIQKTFYRLIEIEGRDGETATLCRQNWPNLFEQWLTGYEQLLADNPYFINDQ